MTAIIDIHAREILKLREQMNGILAGQTGQEIGKIAADTERDYYMSGEEALEYGLVDRVMAQRPLAADAGGDSNGSGTNGSGS